MTERAEEAECPFCNVAPKDQITSDGSAFAIRDAHPVSRGHTLIVSRQHKAAFTDLEYRGREGMHELIFPVIHLLDIFFQPDGYNIGMNIGRAAGQTVEHAHMHIIPRYHGDVGNPKGGVRGVIPGKRDYTLTEKEMRR